MHDYLSLLVRRTFNHTDAIRPRPMGVFESRIPSDETAFQNVPGEDTSEELHFHHEVADPPPMPTTPASESPNAGAISINEKPSTSDAAETVFSKTKKMTEVVPNTRKKVRQYLTASIMPFVTQMETEKKSSSSATVPTDPVQPEMVDRIMYLNEDSTGLIKKRDEPDRGDVDRILPTSEPTGAAEKNTRTGYVKTRKHEGDLERMVSVQVEVEAREHRLDAKRLSFLRAEAQKTSDSCEEWPASQRTDADSGFSAQHRTNTVIAKPNVAPQTEKTGVVPIMPVKSTKEPSSIIVTIGRIEVKANKHSTSEAPQKQKKPSGVMSLDTYLGQFQQGGRG